MKKIVLLFSIATITVFSAKAQDNASGFHFGGGIRVAMPIGDMADVSSFGIGAEVQGEYMFSEMISGTITTGYTHFVGKEYEVMGIKVKVNQGYVPVLAGVRVYPSSNFFIGAKAGYGFLMVDGNSDGAFNYEPQVGYNGEKFQVALGYNGMSKSGTTLSHIGLSAIYKFN